MTWFEFCAVSAVMWASVAGGGGHLVIEVGDEYATRALVQPSVEGAE
jgi:hypothetical protein